MVTYPDALAEKVVSRKELGDKTLKLHLGEKVDMDFVTEVLRSYSFEYVDYVYEPGQYAVRGSIIDVFSFSSVLLSFQNLRPAGVDLPSLQPPGAGEQGFSGIRKHNLAITITESTLQNNRKY